MDVFIKNNEVELAVREWLPVAGTGFYREGIVKLCAKFGQVHRCAWWFTVKHYWAYVEQESCVERFDFYVIFMSWLQLVTGPGVAWWLRHSATSRTVPGSIPGGATGNFFRGFPRRNHVLWSRLSL